ncbi:MAG: ABC transporter ATP-binding protein, partial [Wenzhouxiangellaceae bacterium]
MSMRNTTPAVQNDSEDQPADLPDDAPLVARELCYGVDAPGGRLEIVKDISLTLNAGQTLAIVGASGSGKTTLLGLLAGLETPTDGRVRLVGTWLDSLDEDGRARLRRARVGFVFQSFHLLPSLSALENVMLALEIGGIADARQRALDALEQVGLSHRLQHYPRQLSGGEQQRVAIARAFAGSPDMLFADEPTGNLDRRTGESVADLLFELNREHGTALVTAVLCFLECSRHGLLETELLQLVADERRCTYVEEEHEA